MGTNLEILSRIKGITLLDKDQYKAARPFIPQSNESWWLRPQGEEDDQDGECVDKCGLPHSEITSIPLGIRPALQFANEDISLSPGDKIIFGGDYWTVIPGNMALCDVMVCKAPFRNEWKADNVLDYEASDAKRCLDLYLSMIRALSENMILSFDIALLVRPNDDGVTKDAGLAKWEVKFLLDAMRNDANVIPVRIRCRKAVVMGFIEAKAAEMNGYDAGGESALTALIRHIVDDTDSARQSTRQLNCRESLPKYPETNVYYWNESPVWIAG